MSDAAGDHKKLSYGLCKMQYVPKLCLPFFEKFEGTRGSVFERPPPPILSNYLNINFGAAEDFFQNQVLEAIFFIEDERGCRSKEPD